MGTVNIHPNGVFNRRLSESWPEFVDCEKRLEGEASFLLSSLSKYRSGVIFDAAMGTGCESVFLLRNGFKVVSNEFYPNLIPYASKLAERNAVHLDITSFDWRKLKLSIPNNSFDATILLGNGICMLRDIDTIKSSLFQQFDVLKHKGCLIIDERNYRYILEQKEEILKGNFRYSGNYIYCGTAVRGRPIEISSDNVRIGYFTSDNQLIGTIDTYPFASGELRKLLHDVGFFNIKTYSDFKNEENSKADFYTYVAFKQ